MGERQRRIACLLGVLLALSWTPRNEALPKAVLKQARTTRHPWLMACDANMCVEDFEKESLVPQGADVCGGTERSIYVQVKGPER